MTALETFAIPWGRIGVLSAGLALSLVAAIVFGTRTTSFAAPATAADGIRCALLDDGKGGKPVRCARVLDARPDEVLALIRDYPHFGEVFSGKGWGLLVDRTEKEPDGREHFVARMHSVLGEWPIDAHIEQRSEAGRAIDAWDERGGVLPIDRGFWSVEAAPAGGTLLTYQLEVEVPKLPSFFVRDVLLIELRSPLRRVGRRLDERRHAP